ncbi:MAG: hypothetical protein WD894_09440 [Pirellulales bacterium]
MDDNPYKAPTAQLAPSPRSPPLLWPLAATFGAFFALCGISLLAGFVPSGHVLLFSIAVVVLVLCTGFGIRRTFFGKRTAHWRFPLPNVDQQGWDQAQFARRRFWLSFSAGSITGVILWFWLAPYVQAILEVTMGVYVPKTWIGAAGSLIQVGVCYAAACFLARDSAAAEPAKEAKSSRPVGPWETDL